MKKFFLIPLMTMLCVVMAFAGNVGTLQELKDALEAGGEITLTAAINAGSTELVSAAESTLDLNGFTLSGSQNNGDAGIIKVTGGSLVINATNGGGISAGTYEEDVCSLNAIRVTGGSLTINAGTFVGSYEAIYATAGVVNLNGGTYSSSLDNAVWAKGATLNITDGIYDGTWYDVQVDAGATGSISGGTFKGDNDGTIAVGCYGACGKSFVVTGGTFNGKGIGSYNKNNFSVTGGRHASNPSSFIPNTYLVEYDGEYFTPTLIDETLVAYNISSCKTYTSLETAISEAADFQNIKLLQNVNTPISVAKNIVITLNGKSHNLTANEAEGYYLIANNKTLSFTNAVIHLDYAGSETQVFHSLQAAFNALPENSTPATVKLMSDVCESYNQNAMIITEKHHAILDLNGHTIFSATDSEANTALIDNRGTLTIKDEVGTGTIINQNTNPEDWVGNNQPFPYVAHNTIINRGTLNITGGTILNYSQGGACYAVDNDNRAINGKSDMILNISGNAVVRSTKCDAIRMYVNNYGYKNIVNISGGTVEGYSRAIWLQLDAPTNPGKASFTMSDGTLKTIVPGIGAFYLYSWDGTRSTENIDVNISGGTIEGGISWDENDNPQRGNLTISGGEFTRPNKNGKYLQTWYSAEYDFKGKAISGGTFHTLEDPEGLYNNVKDYVKQGYCLDPTSITVDDKNTTFIVGSCTSVVINKDTLDANNNEYELKEIEEALEEGETLEATIVSIVGAGGAALEQSNDTVIVTVEAGDTVQVHGITGAAEGQLVVKDGATLVIGNGGIVSTNDTLTQIVVEAGGTVAVGTGGVNQRGDATPIEIQSDGEKSGVLLIDPNAPDSVAQAIAKVVVYTRAYKQGGVEHWQQFASPVKGNTIKVTPLGTIGENPQLKTSVYSWDYDTDSWVRIIKASEDDGMDLVPGTTDVYAFSGGSSWITSDAVLKPFAAYDLINNSLPSHGGISYEFAGELVGNNDMILSFPEKGFCLFGNSYTAPIDLVTFFEKIKNDMKADSIVSTNTAIDPCVYLFNSEKNRFESVNSLKLKRWQTKGTEIPFTQIPPQQAFVMNLLKGNSAQSSISYATSVWSNPQSKNVAIMAPKRQEESTISAMVEIHVTDGNATDQVLLVQDDEYNNEYDLGADAMKYMDGAFNLYANTTIGKLDVVATDDIENTELSFQAGNSVNYTMSFNNVEGDFVLVDRANNSQVTIEEGGIYTFAAQPNNTIEGRFAIVPAAKMPTAIGNTEVKSNIKGIYSITGQYLGENFNALPAGVYVIDGVKIVK